MLPTPGCKRALLWVVPVLALAAKMEAQNPDLVFHTVPPCTVVDTRVAGGAFAANETRTYGVVGSGSFASQGGSATGCGVPGFANGIAQVQAVALITTAVTPGGQGNIAANAADQAVLPGVVVTFYPGINSTNTSQVAVAQTSGVGDFKVLVSFSTAHVVIRVVGYYSKPVQTVDVHPVPEDHAASGTALLNAMNGITNASATKRYVIKLEPGIYDLGSTMLTQKPYVDLEGSGQQATVIQGVGNDDFDHETAVVKSANSAEIRNLQIKSAGQGYSKSIALLIKTADTTVRDVTIVSENASGTNWGIRHPSSSAKLDGVTITVKGGNVSLGFSNSDLGGISGLSPIIERTVIDVSSGSLSQGIASPGCVNLDVVRDVQIKASGDSAYGIYIAESYCPGTGRLRLTNSTITAEDFGIYRATGTEPIDIEQSQVRAGVYGVYSLSTGMLTIDHSVIAGEDQTLYVYDITKIGATRLDGGPVNASATCAGVYDENFTFFAGPTCP